MPGRYRSRPHDNIGIVGSGRNRAKLSEQTREPALVPRGG
jgi:hypothetical protein